MARTHLQCTPCTCLWQPGCSQSRPVAGPDGALQSPLEAQPQEQREEPVILHAVSSQSRRHIGPVGFHCSPAVGSLWGCYSQLHTPRTHPGAGATGPSGGACALHPMKVLQGFGYCGSGLLRWPSRILPLVCRHASHMWGTCGCDALRVCDYALRCDE